MAEGLWNVKGRSS